MAALHGSTGSRKAHARTASGETEPLVGHGPEQQPPPAWTSPSAATGAAQASNPSKTDFKKMPIKEGASQSCALTAPPLSWCGGTLMPG